MDRSTPPNWHPHHQDIPCGRSTVRLLPDGNIEETSPESPESDILDELFDIIDGYESTDVPNSCPGMQNISPLTSLAFAVPPQPVGTQHFNSQIHRQAPQQFLLTFDHAPPPPPPSPPPSPSPKIPVSFLPLQPITNNMHSNHFVEHDTFQKRLFDVTVPRQQQQQPRQRSTLVSHISDVTGSGQVHSEALLHKEPGTVMGVPFPTVTKERLEQDVWVFQPNAHRHFAHSSEH